jgi:hypothetical protein
MPSPTIPPAFLADLELVCPKVADGRLHSNFLGDLESAYAHALLSSPQEPSTSDLHSLAEVLNSWRSDRQRQLQDYLKQLPADDPLLNPVSLFGTMDYGRLETAHTRALAWLLDDCEHGFGHNLLEALLLRLLNPEGTQVSAIRVDTVDSEYRVSSESASADAGRLDIVATGHWVEGGKEVSWLMVIEAKIDAAEGGEQLSQYDAWIEDQPHQRKLRIFLTPDGRDAESRSEDSEEWVPMTFLELAGWFRRESARLLNAPGYHFLRYYLTGVLKDVCELPLPISDNCENPFAAVEYLHSQFTASGQEGER